MAVDLEDKQGVYDKEDEAGWKPKADGLKEKEEQAASSGDSSARSAEAPKSTASSSALKSAEEAGGANSLAEQKEGERDFGYREEGKPRNKKRSRRLLIAGAGGGAALMGGLIVLMLILGSLKGVHFATVMRNAGFMTTQMVMRRQFAQIGYENAVLTEDSARGLTAPERTMLDRIRGINARKTLDLLGEQGEFNIFQDRSGVQGFEIRGQRYMMDDYAKQFGKEGYKDLSFRERLIVRNQVLDTVGNEMADVLKAESRSFRNSFFKGFRTHFKIRTSKFARAARDYTGKSPTDAEKKLRTENVERIESGEKPSSSIPQVEEASNQVDEALENDVKNNLRQRHRQWIDTGLKNSGIEGGITGLEDTLSTLSAGVFVATTYCMIHDASNALQGINSQKEQQAQRLAHDIQTTSDQIKSHEVNAEAVGAAASLWDGSANVPPAYTSPLYRQATYKSSSDFDEASAENLPTGYTDFGVVADAINTIDSVVKNAAGGPITPDFIKEEGIDAACSVIMHPGTQILITVGEIVGAVVSAGGTEGYLQTTKQVLGQMARGLARKESLGQFAFFVGVSAGLQALVGMYSDTGFSGAETGADLYNTGAIATNYQNSAIGRGVAYGRPMNKEESEALTQYAKADLRALYQQKPLTERYFAINNPYSLVGNLAATMPSSFGSLVRNFRFQASHVASRVGSVLTGGSLKLLFSQKAQAAEADEDLMARYDYYGIPQWGWTPEELDKIKNDESYDSVKNGGWVIAHNSNGELDQKYDKCYTPAAQTEVPEDCTREYLSTEEAFRWRLYKVQSSVIDQLNDNEVTEESQGSASQTAGSQIVGNPYENSENVACAPGTNDLGVHDAYASGNLIKMRLCALTNLLDTHPESTPGNQYYIQGANRLAIVNSRVSGAWYALVNEAKAAGHNLVASSSFRKMEHQQALWNNSDRTGNGVARPGHSSHQGGVAIDFANMGGSAANGRSCNNRQTWPSAAYNWLVANANRYGFKQYANEAWHWDALPESNRC